MGYPPQKGLVSHSCPQAPLHAASCCSMYSMDLPIQVQWGDVLKNKKITPIFAWGVGIFRAEPFPHRAKYLVPMKCPTPDYRIIVCESNLEGKLHQFASLALPMKCFSVIKAWGSLCTKGWKKTRAVNCCMES
jgi:hypothetical protein